VEVGNGTDMARINNYTYDGNLALRILNSVCGIMRYDFVCRIFNASHALDIHLVILRTVSFKNILVLCTLIVYFMLFEYIAV